jgi:predicted PurR-regulated permease PerM
MAKNRFIAKLKLKFSELLQKTSELLKSEDIFASKVDLYINRKPKVQGNKRRSATSLGSIYGGCTTFLVYFILFVFLSSMFSRLFNG